MNTSWKCRGISVYVSIPVPLVLALYMRGLVLMKIPKLLGKSDSLQMGSRKQMCLVQAPSTLCPDMGDKLKAGMFSTVKGLKVLTLDTAVETIHWSEFTHFRGISQAPFVFIVCSHSTEKKYSPFWYSFVTSSFFVFFFILLKQSPDQECPVRDLGI